MSAFLGPIHYWLFHKIQLQNDLIERIELLNEITSVHLKEELDNKYGTFPEGDLKDIIDESNIHGWLQSYVSQVEYKLADCVTTLMQNDAKMLNQIKSIFFEKGKEISTTITTSDLPEIYKIISDSLLDGMPCDHANTIIDNQENQVIWKRNVCVHTQYWVETGGNVEWYYILREELIKGILASTDFKYEKIDDVTNVIRKVDAYE